MARKYPAPASRERTKGSDLSLFPVANLIDYKLAEFFRLGDFRHIARFAEVRERGELLAGDLDTYADFKAELKKVLEKIKKLQDALYRQPEQEPDGPVNPPVFKPGNAKLDEAKKAVEKSGEDADDLEDQKAIDDLKKAKDALKDENLKKDVKEATLQGSYNDIRKEIGSMIRYLQEIM